MRYAWSRPTALPYVWQEKGAAMPYQYGAGTHNPISQADKDPPCHADQIPDQGPFPRRQNGEQPPRQRFARTFRP